MTKELSKISTDKVLEKNHKEKGEKIRQTSNDILAKYTINDDNSNQFHGISN